MKDSEIMLIAILIGTLAVGGSYYASVYKIGNYGEANAKVTTSTPISAFGPEVNLKQSNEFEFKPTLPPPNLQPPQGQEFKNSNYQYGRFVPKLIGASAVGVNSGVGGYYLYKNIKNMDFNRGF